MHIDDEHIDPMSPTLSTDVKNSFTAGYGDFQTEFDGLKDIAPIAI